MKRKALPPLKGSHRINLSSFVCFWKLKAASVFTFAMVRENAWQHILA